MAKGVSENVRSEKLYLEQVLHFLWPKEAVLEFHACYMGFKVDKHKVLALIGKLKSLRIAESLEASFAFHLDEGHFF